MRRALEELRNHGTLRQDADPSSLAHGLLATLHGGALIARAAQYRAPQRGAADGMLAWIASVCSEAPPPPGELIGLNGVSR